MNKKRVVFIAGLIVGIPIGLFFHFGVKEPRTVWNEGYRAGYSNVTAIAHEQVSRTKRGLAPVANIEQLFLDGMTNNPY